MKTTEEKMKDQKKVPLKIYLLDFSSLHALKSVLKYLQKMVAAETPGTRK